MSGQLASDSMEKLLQGDLRYIWWRHHLELEGIICEEHTALSSTRTEGVHRWSADRCFPIRWRLQR